MFDHRYPDMTCVPYRRKLLYLALTVPYLAILVLVGIYLWGFNPWVTAAVGFCYLWTCFFQAYWCAAQECPYVGRFCPAIAGIVPASWLASWIYGGRELSPSRTRLEVHAALAVLGWVGWTVIPLWWIARLGVGSAAGYVAWQFVYVAVFGLTVCPGCAVRQTCPGGALQRRCLRGGQR